MELEEERLKLDRERFESEKKQYGIDREESRQERTEAQRVELEKFRIMIEVMRGFTGGGVSDAILRNVSEGRRDDSCSAALLKVRSEPLRLDHIGSLSTGGHTRF